MSVIASSSVNFVPVYQILKNFPDTKIKEIQEDKENKIIQDVKTISTPAFTKSQGTQTDFLSEAGFQKNPEKLLNTLEKIEPIKRFILESKNQAVFQQANQSKQSALSLI